MKLNQRPRDCQIPFHTPKHLVISLPSNIPLQSTHSSEPQEIPLPKQRRIEEELPYRVSNTTQTSVDKTKLLKDMVPSRTRELTTPQKVVHVSFQQRIQQKGPTNRGDNLVNRSKVFRWPTTTCQTRNLTFLGIIITCIIIPKNDLKESIIIYIIIHNNHKISPLFLIK